MQVVQKQRQQAHVVLQVHSELANLFFCIGFVCLKSLLFLLLILFIQNVMHAMART